MTDHDDTEARLRAAFGDLQRETMNVNADDALGAVKRSGRPPWLLPVLAAAAVIALVVGFVALRDDDGTDIATPGSTTVVPPVETTTTAPEGESVLTPEEDGYYPWLFPPPTLSWYEEGCPAPESVARNFTANLLGDDDAQLEEIERPTPTATSELDTIGFSELVHYLLRARGEGGTVLDTGTEITLGRIDPGLDNVTCDAWGVISAKSSEHVVMPVIGGKVGNSFTVEGDGEGFEATIAIRVVDDSYRSLFEGSATGGNFGELAPFSTEVTLTAQPVDRNLIAIALSSTGADGAIPPFAMTKFHHDGSTVNGPPAEEADHVAAVVGVAADDVLNVRAAPGADQDIVGEIGPFSVGVGVSADSQPVGGSTWVRVVSDGARPLDGWVNETFLTDLAGTVPADPALLEHVDNVRRALATQPTAALADLRSGTALLLSTDAHVDEEDQELTNEDLAQPDDTPRVWGFEDGTGDPIERTIEDYFAEQAAAPSLADTGRVSFDQKLKESSTVDNLAESYPDATIVELHYPGDPGEAADFTWHTLRLAFAPSDDGYVLVALVTDHWVV